MLFYFTLTITLKGAFPISISQMKKEDLEKLIELPGPAVSERKKSKSRLEPGSLHYFYTATTISAKYGFMKHKQKL